jgi:hypothetical protein
MTNVMKNCKEDTKEENVHSFIKVFGYLIRKTDKMYNNNNMFMNQLTRLSLFDLKIMSIVKINPRVPKGYKIYFMKKKTIKFPTPSIFTGREKWSY